MKKEFQRLATFKDFVGELTVNYRRTKLPTTQIDSSFVAYEFIQPYFDSCMDDHEEFKIIHLNRSNHVVNVDESWKGTDTSCLVSIRDLARNVILIKCSAVILCHNHPSSNLKPSIADQQLTDKIIQALSFFDIKVLDHIILTRESYSSFADKGLI